ncbi:MAG: radical SAM protein, partial [Methanoregula sp.]|nr:radical SAM protein [Methanoregula sp.]
IRRATEFAERVKFVNPDILVILGGVHITTYKILPEPFDLGVIGEGEETMLEIMQTDDPIGNRYLITGLCYNIGGKTYFTEPRPLIEPLDKIPIPDRGITNMDYYCKPQQIIPYHYGRTLTMMTSRGCSFSCIFCSTKIHWQKFRAFSAERVIEEIEILINKYHAEIIHIFDDLFIADKKRFIRIHDMILEQGIEQKVKFMCLVRSDLLDDKIMQMLKEMNVVVIGIGMESGNPKTLEYLKRNTTTIEKNRMAIDLANKYGIPVMGSFMIGNPNETEEELLQTLVFIKEYRASPYLSPLSYIATAFPGTGFWKYAKEKGMPDDFDNMIMDIPHDLETLKKGVLLTDIPVDRFFEIAQMFVKEARYGALKQFVFQQTSFLDVLKAYAGGVLIERDIVMGITEVNKIVKNFQMYQEMEEMRYVPLKGNLKYNFILGDNERELYKPVIRQMFKYVPKMMNRKIPEANVQQAFVLNTVYNFITEIKDPKILCVGSFEDTACASLKKMGYVVEEVDPAINYDLDTFISLPTTRAGSFDIIFSTSVLEHVSDDKTFIEKIAVLLKPEGKAILTCDFNNEYKPGDNLPATDIRFYTETDMMELLKHAYGCHLIDTPNWNGENSFFNEGCWYTFSTMVFGKDR